MRYFLALFTASLLLAAGSLSNRPAPGFSLMDSNGKQHNLNDYRGRIVLIDVMQTTCPHCRLFTKILDKVKAKYGARVVILSVVNPPDNPQTIARFIREIKPSSPVLFDAGPMAIAYFKATPQNPSVDLPHLFIIDGNGWIVSDYGYEPATLGIFEGEALFPVLDRMLAAKPAAPRR